jgi:hypothetical protein
MVSIVQTLYARIFACVPAHSNMPIQLIAVANLHHSSSSSSARTASSSTPPNLAKLKEFFYNLFNFSTLDHAASEGDLHCRPMCSGEGTQTST